MAMPIDSYISKKMNVIYGRKVCELDIESYSAKTSPVHRSIEMGVWVYSPRPI